ncbi:uncharacterized protein EDB91DRAFT_1255257 [Suillus paluster]|uniref:uncharacterized protein n=1 Tax=Suillus paluster TaxID=48578 RepID=UPI001B85C6D8|nr:uncharacterized protein EDB91DRAFT_1255257 [Suillus paluster]KAG1724393.1 hypothetical protein EDB91DRAFT_1255257 [Suillus paluster]
MLTAPQNMSWRLNTGESSLMYSGSRFDPSLLLTQPRKHCMLFPNNWSITDDVLTELEQMILHAMPDNIALTTSVIPFNQEELTKMLDLMACLKYAIDKWFPHAKCIVAWFMENFALVKFFNFAGSPKQQHSLLIQISFLCLFYAPWNYTKELDDIYVDKLINRTLWKQFTARLQDDWSALAITATVMLNANIALLALVSDAPLAKLFSCISMVKELLERISHPIFGTEALAIIYSLPYTLLIWSMVFFVVAFACMVYRSQTPVRQFTFNVTFGVTGGLVFVLVCWTAWMTRVTKKD